MEKEVKEIVIKQNAGIVFPYDENATGDILILGNFNGICGQVIWEGVGKSKFDTENFLKYQETFETNLHVLINTLRAGNRIFIAASKETIDYFKKLLYTIADWCMSDMPEKKRKKMFNKQVWTIDTTELYERTYVKYNSNSEYRKDQAQKKIDDIVTNKIFEKLSYMKFDYIIQNPPYNGSLHLDFLTKGLDLLSDKGRMVIIEPATWLINVKKNGKASMYDELKKKLAGHVESIVIENRNKDFNTSLSVPFATTVVDMSKTYDEIEFTCFGEKKIVKSLYDCNLVGDYAIIWSILRKVRMFGDMMREHTTKTELKEDVRYAKYQRFIPVAGCLMTAPATSSSEDVMYASDTYWRSNLFGEFLTGYFTTAWHTGSDNKISAKIHHAKKKGASKEYSDAPTENIFGTAEELENWRNFIFNNKLPLFINIAVTFSQDNNSKDFLPWLVDKQYTDEEINKLFGFTDEEIALIDRTIKKYERNSPWFKRYMCGPDSVSDEEVNNFINNL